MFTALYIWFLIYENITNLPATLLSFDGMHLHSDGTGSRYTGHMAIVRQPFIRRLLPGILCGNQRLTVPFLLTGTFVVNLGDCLQAWTKGLYRATRHRVRRSIKTDRYSVPLFFNPNRGCIIEPIETDVTRNLTFTKIVKGVEMPFRYGDFARTLLEKSHDWSRRQNNID